jgi:cephalosporin hydroxylase
MDLRIDTGARTLTTDGKSIDLYSDEGFKILSDLWLKVGWNQKYTYTFQWMGVPVIQLPDDMVRTQEVIWRVRPDVIIECGVAHGGGTIFMASLCKAMGKGRVIGVELEFRGENRKNIENHLLAPLITLVEASSIAPETVEKVRGMIAPGETVMVVLDSNHTKAHVAAELEAYAGMVTKGSYIVATDGCMEYLEDVPRGKEGWATDNPAEAARDFVRAHPEFVIDMPKPIFNESTLAETPTHWPDAWLKRVA